MKKVLIVLLVISFVALTATAFAFGPGMRAGNMGAGWHGAGKKFAADLNLTKEQTDALTKLREKHWADTQALRNEMVQKRLELRKMFVDPSVKDATILAKEKEINTLTQQMHDKMLQLKLEQRKIFTTEQMTKMNAAIEKFQGNANGGQNAARFFGGRGSFGHGCGRM
jgi:Spy/CpxP family protein refolding chaperone